jgi:TolA-binding protein
MQATGTRTVVRAGLVLALAVLLAGVPRAEAQLTPDQAAEMLLASARKAFDNRDHAFAIARYREFLGRFGGHKLAPVARYGLAQAILESAQPNLTEARDLLQGLSGNRDFAEHAGVLYHLGLAWRGLGMQELAVATARPQEEQQRRAAARQRFEEAARQFAAASAAFLARAGQAPGGKAELPLASEWAARARCDLAEMQLRTDKAKEAQSTALPFLKDPLWTRSRFRDLGRYYHGFASFQNGDYAAAERTLSLLAPFADPTYGTHARYLLGRTHHRAEELAEAVQCYEAVLLDYAKNKQAAAEALRRPDQLKKNPGEKARLEALVRDPAPDHVARSAFYLGVLRYEAGRFAEARARFAEFANLYATSPLRAEAQLRLGFCQVQLKEYAEAQKTLQSLLDRERRLSDQALFWLAKARVGAAPTDAKNPAREQALRGAVDVFRQAADRAQELSRQDSQAKARRAEILLEMADTMQQARLFKEAVGAYNQLLSQSDLPRRQEEIHLRLIQALHLGGDFDGSERAIAQFREKYPKSILLPEVAFRHAENSYFRALAADKNAADRDRLFEEAGKRYQLLIDRYPEFPQVNLARYGLAVAFYRRGDLEKARQTLETIPQSERTGTLAGTSYLIADCLLRLAPEGVPDDALAAGKLEEQLRTAAEQLEAFVNGQPGSPERPDALLRLGNCQQRLAGLLAQPPDKAKALASARAAYEQFQRPPLNQHGNQPLAILERAKVLAAQGDVNGAINELRRFTNELRESRPAPLAVVHLATLLRAQKRPADAAGLLVRAREVYEPLLPGDPERAGWVILLRYHHGLALREAGKLTEARSVFELVAKQAHGKPEGAEAALRWGQCLKEEGRQKLTAAAKAQGGQADTLRAEGGKMIRDAVTYLEGQAEQLKENKTAGEARARMLYEIAWSYRDLADLETAADAKKNTPPSVPPSELKARAQYLALLSSYPDLPLAADARFELTELYAQRNEHEAAIKLLAECLDKEPPPELTQKIRLRLGACQAAAGNLKAALTQFDTVAQIPKSPLAAQAHYRAGECLYAAKEYAEAVKRLALFRDRGEFQNLPGLTDRALLRLGHAYAHLKEWDRSRQAHEQLASRFGNSPWVHEARYGMGWAWQQQRQYDQAVNVYQQVVTGTPTETAAKAQLQIGLCRLEQKRYADAATALLAVPFTYDFPELSAVALLEASRAYQQLKQAEQAERLLRRVIRDHPRSRWAEAAQERLENLKGG